MTSNDRTGAFLFTVTVVTLLCSAPAWAQETVRFAINRFEIVGNTLLPAEDLARRVAPFTGVGKVYGDVQKALDALESAYRERGFGAVQVLAPEQELTQGVVRLRVIESRIGKISVSGNNHFDQSNILASLPALSPGLTPNARAVSESVQLANENPAKKVDVVLGLGAKDDELDAAVTVKDERPWSATLSSDNTGNKGTGRDRTGITLQHANVFNRDHVATFSWTSSVDRPQSTQIFGLSYRVPLYRLGDSIDVIFGKSDVAAATATTVAGPLAFSGSGRVAGLRYNLILPRQAEFAHRFVLGIDQRDFDNACTLAGQALCGAGGADITLRPVSVTYAAQLNQATSASSFSLTASANAGGGANGSSADFQANRADARSGYAVLRGSLTHMRAFSGDWQLRGNVNVQYTRDALVSGEQFGLVGASAVRGFQERAVTADKGYFGSMELYSPDLAGLGGMPGSMRVLGFYDFGHGSFNKTAPGSYARDSVASAGVGLRYSMGRNTSVRADMARVVEGGVAETSDAGDWRGHVGVVIGF